MTASVTPISSRRVDLVQFAFARKLQLLQGNDPFQRRRLALQNENVPGLDHHISRRLIAALAASKQGDHFDIILAKLLQCLHRDAVCRNSSGTDTSVV